MSLEDISFWWLIYTPSSGSYASRARAATARAYSRTITSALSLSGYNFTFFQTFRHIYSFPPVARSLSVALIPFIYFTFSIDRFISAQPPHFRSFALRLAQDVLLHSGDFRRYREPILSASLLILMPRLGLIQYHTPQGLATPGTLSLSLMQISRLHCHRSFRLWFHSRS